MAYNALEALIALWAGINADSVVLVGFGLDSIIEFLAAGVLLVQGAGGEVTDLSGTPIDPVGHEGPFIAAVDDAARGQVTELVREAVSG